MNGLIISTSVFIFALAALVGFYMLRKRMDTGQNPSVVAVVIHGMLAAAGFYLFILVQDMIYHNFYIWLGFMVALPAGFVMVTMHIGRKELPVKLILLHGGAAVCSVTFWLIMYILIMTGMLQN